LLVKRTDGSRPTPKPEILYDPISRGSERSEIEADIVAVHGLGSDPFKAWTHRRTGANWLADFLPSTYPKCRILAVNHDSRWDADAPVQSLREYGKAILTSIVALRREDEEKKRPLIFVGHSFGGILIKKALIAAGSAHKQSPERDVADAVAGVLFLGSPHRGANVARIGTLISFLTYWHGSRSELLEYLSPDTRDIEDLHRTFLEMFEPVHICNFLENRPLMIGGIPLFQVVKPESARIQEWTNVVLDGDHKSLNKFQDASDNNYLRVRGEFQVALDHFSGRQFVEKTRRGFDIPFKRAGLPIISKFVGRTPELATMEEVLLSSRHLKKQKRLVIHGLGGMGKTQLALAYAISHQEQYSSIFWVSAKSKQTLERSIASLAEAIPLQHVLNSSGKVTQTDEFIEIALNAVMAWLSLEYNDRWLLILDNADSHPSAANDNELDIRRYFLGQGTVIITTRLSFLHGLGWSVDLDRVPVNDGLHILSDAAGEDLENEDSRGLIERLGGLPLAINAAGSYISETGITAAKYSELLVKQARRLMLETPALTEYENGSIMSTWEISFEAVKIQNENAAALFLLCTFLDPSDLFFDLFAHSDRKTDQNSTDEPVPLWLLDLSKDEMSFYNAIKPLRAFSFFRENEGHTSYSIHPLVHEWGRLRLQNNEAEQMLTCAVSLISNAIPETFEHDEPAKLRRLIPHADHLMAVLGENDIYAPGGFFGIAYLYGCAGRYKLAEPIALRVLAARRRYSGEDSALTLDAMRTVAAIYSATDRKGEAEELLLRVVPGMQNAFGKYHLRTLQSIENLGSLYETLDRFEDAAKLLEDVLSARRRIAGGDDRRALNTMAMLGHLYDVFERFKDAEVMYLRAMAGYERAYGPDHPSTLHVVNDLACLYGSWTRYDDALALYNRTIVGLTEALGHDHPTVSITISNLANLYRTMGRFEDAEEQYLIALAGQENALGEHHTESLRVRAAVGGLYDIMNRYDDAEAMLLRAVDGLGPALGPEHSGTLVAVKMLGDLYLSQEKVKQAEPLLMRAFLGLEKVFGPLHSYTLTSAGTLGRLYLKLQRFDEAELIYQRVLQGRLSSASAGQERLWDAYFAIGQLRERQGRLYDAEIAFEQAFNIRKRAYGLDNVWTQTVAKRLEHVREGLRMFRRHGLLTQPFPVDLS
ncbi:MAG: hypothetical protein M1830_009753, partial [Pleopsidium flavum]